MTDRAILHITFGYLFSRRRLRYIGGGTGLGKILQINNVLPPIPSLWWKEFPDLKVSYVGGMGGLVEVMYQTVSD